MVAVSRQLHHRLPHVLYQILLALTESRIPPRESQPDLLEEEVIIMRTQNSVDSSRIQVQNKIVLPPSFVPRTLRFKRLAPVPT